MSKRTIMEIDQDICDGCGACATGCPEGALRIIEGKARLVGESLCDGLGACIGACPKGAIHVVEREADEYDEISVLKEILPQGSAVLAAHFSHLDRHGQDLYLDKAVMYLRSLGMGIPQGFEGFGQKKTFAFTKPCGVLSGLKAEGRSRTACVADAAATAAATEAATSAASPLTANKDSPSFPDRPSGESKLKNWPVQLHLANPRAPYFAKADVVVAADCTAFALGSFHADIVSGRALVIACPKLDSGKDVYIAKLASILAQAASVSVLMMEVPCCSGLLKLVREAKSIGCSSLPIETLVIGIDGGFVARKTIV